MDRLPMLLPSPEVNLSRALVQIEQLSRIHGVGETSIWALRDVNLTVQQGEYCAIMGTSGSGKSTLMHLIGCLDRPTSGRYYLDGVNVAALNDDELALVRNLKIGFVFQQFHLLSQLTVIENVMLPMIYANVDSASRRNRAMAALQQVGLDNRSNDKPNHLSGGQQQRVAIARAIVNQPTLLLADEPTGALDSATTQDIMAIFEQFNASGITVILVTHDPAVASCARRRIKCCDGVIC